MSTGIQYFESIIFNFNDLLNHYISHIIHHVDMLRYYCKKCNWPLISTKKADRVACILNCLQLLSPKLYEHSKTMIHPSFQKYATSVIFRLEFTNFLESTFTVPTEGLEF